MVNAMLFIFSSDPLTACACGFSFDKAFLLMSVKALMTDFRDY